MVDFFRVKIPKLINSKKVDGGCVPDAEGGRLGQEARHARLK